MSSEQWPGLRPLIFWEGFPPCGLMVKRVADLLGDRLIVLGTRPAVPFEGLEEMLGHEIEWLGHPDEIWERRAEFADRNLIIHTGWSHSGWLRFDRWMKERGAVVVVTVDNQFKGNPRQWVGALWFRLRLRRHFDAALVPGRSATKLMQFLGMSADRIQTGYYGAYEGLYSAGPPILDRPKEFLFVGQLIARKGVDLLLEAFGLYRRSGGDWTLRILGSGPLSDSCTGDGIVFEGFAQARLVSQRMKETRCLVLPSREDHWPTVVCEAAASGMLLITSRFVGSAEDLVCRGINGEVCGEMTSGALFRALNSVANLSEELLQHGQDVSLGLARGYTSNSYLAAFSSFARRVESDDSVQTLQVPDSSRLNTTDRLHRK